MCHHGQLLLRVCAGQKKKSAICNPEESPRWDRPHWHPDPGLSVPRTVRKKFPLFISHSVYGASLIAAQAKTHAKCVSIAPIKDILEE